MLARRLLSIAMVCLAATAARQAGGPPARGAANPEAAAIERKLGRDLTALVSEYEEYRQTNANARGAGGFRSAHRHLPVLDGEVVIDAVASGDAAALLADVTALGLRRGAAYGRLVSGRIPVESLRAVAALPTLRFVRAAAAGTLAGSVTSQGDASMRAGQARATFGVDGTGITVGILSSTFDCQGTGLAADIASGDLPADTVVLDDSRCPGNDEGRAMGQVVHDVAPGARLAFRTALDGQAGFATGIGDLVAQGAEVLVDDVYYLTEPMFQDGIIAQALDAAAQARVTCFSAAGNLGRRSYAGAYRSSSIPVLYGGDAHDFDPGPGVDVYQAITIPVDGEIVLGLQWDSPYFSVSGGSGTPNDLDVCLLSDPPTTTIACGADFNLGGDPVETLSFFNDGAWGTAFNLVIERYDGPAPGRIQYVLFADGAPVEHVTDSGAIFGHANAAGVAAVGAAFYDDTPAFGTSPALVSPSSSAGGTPILFDAAGVRLPAPEIRPQPLLVGPDGVNNTFFGTDIADPGDQTDKDKLPNFFGTSAAAAHAAGTAALLLDRSGALAPDDVHAALAATADDMDDPATTGFDAGFDFATGFGFCSADVALGSVPPCGDGAVQPPEECDDANAVDDDACGDDCLANVCGDGVLHPGNGEQCDDGNGFDDDFCRDDCRPNFCGDGRVTNFQADLLVNGDFEAGTLGGWRLAILGDGTFRAAVPGADTPASRFATAPNPDGGSWYALVDQVNSGTHALEQSFTVPGNAGSLVLSFQMFVNDQSGVGPIVDPIGLDHTGPPNQHARVDVLGAGSPPLDTGAGVVAGLYVGVDPGANPHPYTGYSFDLLGVAPPGETCELRFAEVDNQYFLHLGVDNVRVVAGLIEECDDGNQAGGDGCSAACTLEACARPAEVAGLRFFADGTAIQWDVVPGAGAYDVVRAEMVPIGSGPEVCLARATVATSAGDAANPAAQSSFFYIVRARNGCGPGTYGFSFSGAERLTGACP